MLGVAFALTARPTAAQQPEGDTVAPALQDTPPPDTDPVQDASPTAPREAEPEGETPQAPQPPESLLTWTLKSLGWTYSITFLGLSFVFVALFVMNVLGARRENVCPSDLVEGFEKHLNDRQYQEAYELARTDESFLGQVLSAGLAKLSSGYNHAVEAMQEVSEEEIMKLEHRLSYIHLIGTISPMVGLLGTVDGMCRSFRLLAVPGVTPKPWELATGISTALVTTLVGLMIAIPAIAAYGILRNRIARLVLEVGILSEGLMGRFESVGTPKKD
jgi:biopolymer transport protein ExbB